MESVCECSDCSGSQGFPQLRSDAVRTPAKFRSETKLTAEERDYLTYRIMQYKQRLDELRIFFQSGRFVLLTDIDGIQLLKRLEREIA